MPVETLKKTIPRVTNPKTGKVKVSKKAKIEQRSFVCVSVNGEQQEYNQTFGANPKAAAKKHFTSWCRKKNKKNNCKAVIIIKESTRGSNNKQFSYEAIRQKYDTPKKILRDGKEIKYKYGMTLTSIKN